MITKGRLYLIIFILFYSLFIFFNITIRPMLIDKPTPLSTFAEIVLFLSSILFLVVRDRDNDKKIIRITKKAKLKAYFESKYPPN